MADATILRLQQELAVIARNPDNQILISASEENIRHIHVLICGPYNTPYSLGFFDFVIDCSGNYPTEPPKAMAKTTAYGATRFNPNIYACGKVCLSLLGTWRGEGCEKWSAVHGISSLCISIQSLMNDKPYLNEPGYENEKNDSMIEKYNQKIMHETLRISVCDRLEELLNMKTMRQNAAFCKCSVESPFGDMIKLMFLWYYDIYMGQVEKDSANIADGTKFTMMRFEHNGNGMRGEFCYKSIRQRLTSIHNAILNETDAWVDGGKKAVDENLLIVKNLQAQYDQIIQSEEFESNMSIELIENNPFHWRVVVYGPRDTHYEDGLFEAPIIFHPSFPTAPPRIRFQTSVFHPNIASNGMMYFSVSKPSEIRQYLMAIVSIFRDEPLSSPSTHLNLQAAELYYGDETQRRAYARNARRCAQRSLDC